jgi:hypothetical protein
MEARAAGKLFLMEVEFERFRRDGTSAALD